MTDLTRPSIHRQSPSLKRHWHGQGRACSGNAVERTELLYLGPDADLQGCDLAHIVFDGDLTGANLADADLYSAYLNSANLTDANLIGANLSEALLASANLTGANLTGALMEDTGFIDTNVTDVNMTDASMAGAFVTQSIFTGDTWSNTVCPDFTNSNNDGGTCDNNFGPHE